MLFYLVLSAISILQCRIVYGDNNQSQTSCDECTKFLEELNSLSAADFEDHVNFVIPASMCSHASSTFLQGYANQFLSVPLFQLVPFNLSSKSICSFMDACPQTSHNKEEVQDFVFHSTLPQLVQNVMLCEECEHCVSAVAGISTLMSDKETYTIAKASISTICNKLPFQKFPECNKLLNLYYDQVFLLVNKYLAQNEFCSQESYCPATPKNYILQPETVTQNSSEIDFLPSEECLSCQLVESAISALLKNEQSRHIVKTNLSEICNWSQECQGAMDLYIDQIFEILLQNLKGYVLCAYMEYCPHYKFSVQIPGKLLQQTILSDGECQYCYMAAGEVFAFFQNDLTKQIVWQNFGDILEFNSIFGDILFDEVLQSLLKFIFEYDFCAELGYCSESFGEIFFSIH